MKLFKVENPLVIYVLAYNEKEARLEIEGSDSGGEDYENFIETARTGTIIKLNSLEQVPLEDHNYVVFGGGNDMKYYGCSIKEFFDLRNCEE